MLQQSLEYTSRYRAAKVDQVSLADLIMTLGSFNAIISAPWAWHELVRGIYFPMNVIS